MLKVSCTAIFLLLVVSIGSAQQVVRAIPPLQGIWDGAGLLKSDGVGIMAKISFQAPEEGKVAGELLVVYPSNTVINYRFIATIKNGTINIEKDNTVPVGMNNRPGTGMEERLLDISNSGAMSNLLITAQDGAVLKMVCNDPDYAATIYFRKSIIDPAANQAVLATVNKRRWDDSIRKVPGLQYHLNYLEFSNLQYNQRFLEAGNDNTYYPNEKMLIVRKKNFQPFALYVPPELVPSFNFKILLQHTLSQYIVSGSEQLKGYFLYCGQVYNLGNKLLDFGYKNNHIWPTEPRLFNGPADTLFKEIDYHEYLGVWEGVKHFDGKATKNAGTMVPGITDEGHLRMTITSINGYTFKGYSYQYFFPDSSHNHSIEYIEGYFTRNGIDITSTSLVKQQLKKYPKHHFCDLQFFAQIEKDGEGYTMKGETPTDGDCQGGTFSMHKKIKAAALPADSATRITTTKYLERKTETIRKVEVETDSVKIGFADNAIVDGDSISVFVNDSLVISHQFLQTKPFFIYVPLGEEPVRVSMFAENLGSIAPNTAMMTIFQKDKKTEVRMSSDMNSNATIYLQKKKPKK